MGIEDYAKRVTRWGSIGFFAGITAATFIGIPLYARYHGVLPADVLLFFTYSFATILAITAGYHRLYSHHAYKAHRVVEAMLLFFGAAAVQQSAVKWSALHRQHHRYTDTSQDPYDIKRGFFHAHIGWLLFWKYHVNYDSVQDLLKNPLAAHQHKHFQSWVLIAGVLTPVAIGVLYGSWMGGLLFGVALRLFVVYNSTFCINSVAHTLGTQNYDTTVSARDSFICALLTNGEGYHNYHHRFPSDYRNGVRWYHWDPSKWFVWILEKIRLAGNLNRAGLNAIQNAQAHPSAAT